MKVFGVFLPYHKDEILGSYYGGYEEKAWWECNLKTLYKTLLEKGLITEE